MHVVSNSGGPKVMTVAASAVTSVPMTAQRRKAPVGPNYLTQEGVEDPNGRKHAYIPTFR